MPSSSARSAPGGSMFKRLVEGAEIALIVDGKPVSAARAGLSTVLFDENPGIGGQIYRGITSTPVSDHALLGEDYWAGATLADEAARSGALIVTGASVWSLNPAREIGVSIAGQARLIE